jgi:hypothetical protein
MILDMAKTANFFLTSTFKVVSKYTSISEMFGVLRLNQLDAKKEDSNKEDFEIGEKQTLYYGRQVCDFVSTSICANIESPSIYIKPGVRYSAGKSTGDLIEINLFIYLFCLTMHGSLVTLFNINFQLCLRLFI